MNGMEYVIGIEFEILSKVSLQGFILRESPIFESKPLSDKQKPCKDTLKKILITI